MVPRKILTISIVIFVTLLILFYSINYFLTDEKNFTKIEKNKLIYFEFENDLKNNLFTICKSDCDGILQEEIEYVNSNEQNAIMFNDENGGWVEIPFNEIRIQNENGMSISFWVSVHTHEKRHNMIYNKGPVGWGSSHLKSINGLYEGDLREFQALWTGNDIKQYLNLHCNDGQEIVLDKWYFVVHVLEKDQSTLRQYINGEEYCNTKSKMPIDFETQHNLILGKVIGTYDDTSNMTLDNFAIYSHELNGEEIQEIFRKGLENRK